MNIGVVILVSGGAIGILCSLLSVWVLFRKSRWNGYNHLMLMLTVAQLIYDISVVMVPFPGIFTDLLYISLRSMSGLCATFVTNVFSAVIVYTAWTLRTYDIRSKIKWIAVIIVIPSSICGILVSYTLHYYPQQPFVFVSQFYYWTRIASILFNILCYCILVYKLRIVKSLPAYKRGNDPLHTLASRYKYYPMLQVFTRAFVSYYEYKYGFNYHIHTSFTKEHQIALILYVLTLPAAGLGFFVIYMKVSPGAAECLLRDVFLLYRSIRRLVCVCVVGDNDEDRHRDSALRSDLLGAIDDSGRGLLEHDPDRATFMSARPLYPDTMGDICGESGDGVATGDGSSEYDSLGSSERNDAHQLQLQYRSRATDDDSFVSWNTFTQGSSSPSADTTKYGNRPGGRSPEDDDDSYSDWSEGELSTEISRLYRTSSPRYTHDRHTMYSIDSSAFAMFVDNCSTESSVFCDERES